MTHHGKKYLEAAKLVENLRPLLAEEGKSPSEISRRDEVMESPAGAASSQCRPLTSIPASLNLGARGLNPGLREKP